GHRHFHIQLAETVEDKVEGQAGTEEGVTVLKSVHIAPIHAAIVLKEGKLFYKHLGKLPTLVASKKADSRILRKPGTAVPLVFGQSVGLGSTEDAFGHPMWWYYVRVYPLRYLKRQLAVALAASAKRRAGEKS